MVENIVRKLQRLSSSELKTGTVGGLKKTDVLFFSEFPRGKKVAPVL